ncbi:TetR/AcrR family transcriptional regulator [Mucilaginibacter sp. OK283]|uniref:TetR/AcrR family transcriptional regulator n=1 Tax=Mucilaginibacter sp. OK283 TaxID=1881049 RepID=UPI0008ABE677|nr:TetR/AcrR family transcriptional regulator [Mucilaginibacter sp. OK283]SEP40413.1 transcriptional regulator, TetR family [Mucilaginibacter sp. OK283]
MFYKKDSYADPEKLIKVAAKKVFLKKGLKGARLQEIADEAGIARTALHYYFRSKEKLFLTVLRDVFYDINLGAKALTNQGSTIVEKMEFFVTQYFDKVCQEPGLDLFILNEFNTHPNLMKEVPMDNTIISLTDAMLHEIEKAVERKEITGNPKQIFMTLMAICMFPFAASGLLQNILKLNNEQYFQLMSNRKAYVINFLKMNFN